jgi:hypothetical protein
MSFRLGIDRIENRGCETTITGRRLDGAVGDELVPQTQPAPRKKLRIASQGPSRLEEIFNCMRWPFTIRRHCMVAAAA